MPEGDSQQRSRVAGLVRRAHLRRSWWRGLLGARGAGVAASVTLGWPTLAWLVMALAAAALSVWTREQPLVAPGRVMDDTVLVRNPLTREDPAVRLQNQEAARNRTPRVYALETAVLEGLRAELLSLPKALEGARAVEQVDESLRERFGLTPEILASVRAEAAPGDGDVHASDLWQARVQELVRRLQRRPILEETAYQRAVLEGLHPQIKLRLGEDRDAPVVLVARTAAVSVRDMAQRREAAGDLARQAGFEGPQQSGVVNRLLALDKPTFREDAAATTADQEAAAALVPVTISTNPAGQVIFRRGEVLAPDQRELYRAELANFRAQVSPLTLAARWAAVGLLAAAAMIAMALAGAVMAPRRPSASWRLGAVALALLAGVCTAGVLRPELLTPLTLTAAALGALVLTVGIGARGAMVASVPLVLMIALALDQGAGQTAAALAVALVVAAMLRDVRERAAMIRAAVAGAMVAALAAVLAGLIERPIAASVTLEVLTDAALAAGGVVLAGSATLFALPLIERFFKVSTGITLVELRDPKQPLLRELQRRAPGTYNHSLSVASIAELAADAVGGDALLTYVGALYHDIGKMNKPEYFAENQGGGASKHDRLSPAMSVLVIMGHVKDGLELAREFGLPESIWHFIESHHGTTLVEYFYHRAVEQAEDTQGQPGAQDAPEPIVYRYAGPKPRTKEAVAVMISDAVESASRTLADPTPGRIEALVRAIAQKRLTDGQFDECAITMRELGLMVESIARSVTAIYHGRVVYPESQASRA